MRGGGLLHSQTCCLQALQATPIPCLVGEYCIAEALAQANEFETVAMAEVRYEMIGA